MDFLPAQDLEISLLFRKVRDQVLAATENLQEPYVYGSLTGVPFYLAGSSGGAETRWRWTTAASPGPASVPTRRRSYWRLLKPVTPAR